MSTAKEIFIDYSRYVQLKIDIEKMKDYYKKWNQKFKYDRSNKEDFFIPHIKDCLERFDHFGHLNGFPIHRLYNFQRRSVQEIREWLKDTEELEKIIQRIHKNAIRHQVDHTSNDKVILVKTNNFLIGEIDRNCFVDLFESLTRASNIDKIPDWFLEENNTKCHKCNCEFNQIYSFDIGTYQTFCKECSYSTIDEESYQKLKRERYDHIINLLKEN